MPDDSTGVTAHRDRPFHETPERTLKLDVFEPVESGPRPAMLFVHGGAFVEGDKDQLERYAREFAGRGYVPPRASIGWPTRRRSRRRSST